MVLQFEARTAYNCGVDIYREPIESVWKMPAKSTDIGHLYWYEDDLLFHLETDHPSDSFAKIFKLSSDLRVAIISEEAWTLRANGTKLVLDFALSAQEHPLGLVIVGRTGLVLVTEELEHDIEHLFDSDLNSIQIINGEVFPRPSNASHRSTPLEGYLPGSQRMDPKEIGALTKFKSAVYRFFRR